MSAVTLVKYCIIGGGVAGVTAAERIRELDKNGEICIISAESELLYSRVLLPDYISGKVDRAKCFLRTRESYHAQRIQLRLGEEVTEIAHTDRTLTTNKGAVITYEKLLIATGGRPHQWSVPGSDALPVFRLQTIADADAISQFVADHPGARMTVVGGGFISMESMEALALKGIHVTLLVREECLFQHLMPARAHELLWAEMKEHSVTLVSNCAIERIEVVNGEHVLVAGSHRIVTDAVVVGVGIERDLSVVRAAGIPAQRGVIVDEYLASHIPHVYAAGDIAEYADLTFGCSLVLGNWTASVLMGRVAGENMAGGNVAYQHIPLYALEHFGVKIQIIGIPSTAGGFENIEICDVPRRTYLSLSLKNSILVGAVTMNRGRDLGVILKWMKERKNLSTVADQLRSGVALAAITP
ncbi:MAG: FAD-dependent oxidoreductase [Patescibacteria group bacterium]